MFKYETHLHTSEASACSKMTGEEAADYFKSLGYSGVFVTDHFFNGNTAIPKMDDWEKRIDLFCKGYENCKKRGKEIGLDVFFAFEFQYAGTHFLIYNLDKNWLKKHSEIMDMRLTEFLNFAKKEGALVVQAHPFREAEYIEFIRLLPRHVDLVEYNNSCDDEKVREIGKFYADHYSLPGFAGSDIHSTERKRLGGLSFEKKISDVKEFTELVKSGNFQMFIDDHE